jgi:hypothetical protein
MAEEDGTQQLPFVKETVLKKRKVNEDWAIKNRERKAAKKQRRRNDAKGAIKRPEDFVREFRNKELDFMRMRTRLKVRSLRPAEPVGGKLLFAIRIPGSVAKLPEILAIATLFGLLSNLAIDVYSVRCVLFAAPRTCTRTSGGFWPSCGSRRSSPASSSGPPRLI